MTNDKKVVKNNPSTEATELGASGALAGAAMGLVAGGPIGAAVGAAVGAVTGAIAGGTYTYADHEASFRDEYEKSADAKSGHSWDKVSPAYQYGFESYDRSEYKGKPFSEVSPHLQKEWKGESSYADMEPHVRRAYERRSALHAGTGMGASSEVESSSGASRAKS